MFSFTKVVAARRASPFAVYLSNIKNEAWFTGTAAKSRLAVAASRYATLPPKSRAALERQALATRFYSSNKASAASSAAGAATTKAKCPNRARPETAYRAYVTKFLKTYNGSVTKGSEKLKLAAAAWKKAKK